MARRFVIACWKNDASEMAVIMFCFDENETGKMACYCAKLDNSDDKNGIQCQRTTSSSEGAAVRYQGKTSSSPLVVLERVDMAATSLLKFNVESFVMGLICK